MKKKLKMPCLRCITLKSLVIENIHNGQNKRSLVTWLLKELFCGLEPMLSGV